MNAFVKHFSSAMSSQEILALYDKLVAAYEREQLTVRLMIDIDEYLSLYTEKH